jgi:hypothetical protein
MLIKPTELKQITKIIEEGVPLANAAFLCDVDSSLVQQLYYEGKVAKTPEAEEFYLAIHRAEVRWEKSLIDILRLKALENSSDLKWLLENTTKNKSFGKPEKKLLSELLAYLEGKLDRETYHEVLTDISMGVLDG